MGKPRMIILVRHGQSEGNKNRDIHQFIPDHRVKLTPNGWNQAEEAGRRLRSMLKPDDTLQFFTSPYRRTRETTEGILRTLTADEPTPSPFPRHKIKVFEEPRLREQDFGNFQPCSAEMERMWQERADYGHFFYRIQNGESAADAYDRVSGFNESMWRQFGDEDFPSVCVLVTHGLMTRVFLMKWYHWSVEYFEDLRNVNHCEFIIMKQSLNNGKYILENELRTWSDLKRRAAAAATAQESGTGTTPTSGRAALASVGSQVNSSPTIPVRRWGGCVNGCDHDKMDWPKRPMRKNTMEYMGSQKLPAPALPSTGEQDDHPIASQEAEHTPSIKEPIPPKLTRKPSGAAKAPTLPSMPLTPASPNDASNDASSDSDEGIGSSGPDDGAARGARHPAPRTAAIMRHLHPLPHVNRSGVVSPGEGLSDDSDYFPGMRHLRHAHDHHGHDHNHSHSHTARPSPSKLSNGSTSKSRLRANSKHRQESKERKAARKQTEKSWMEESGMLSGARADALGDGDDGASSEDAAYADKRSESPTNISPTEVRDNEKEKPILREALKGDMIVENSEEEQELKNPQAELDVLKAERKTGEQQVDEQVIEEMKKEDRKGFGEVY